MIELKKKKKKNVHMWVVLLSEIAKHFPVRWWILLHNSTLPLAQTKTEGPQTLNLPSKETEVLGKIMPSSHSQPQGKSRASRAPPTSQYSVSPCQSSGPPSFQGRPSASPTLAARLLWPLVVSRASDQFPLLGLPSVVNRTSFWFERNKPAWAAFWC